MAGSEAKYKLNGKFGLKAIADDNKTSVGSIRRRLQSGMTLEEAVADILKNQQLSKEKRNKKKKPKPKRVVKTVGRRKPEKMDRLWCLALGVKF
ncbi:hypothetical protein vBVpPvVp04M_00058 [Vibrio phage vB_Vp_PvVp04_M]|nr:hypothetical protein vBVpPvVp04M_00058 [Vibrio phage vB_Vp_PvVp04_M]